MEAWATLPDGTRTWLIKIADWDINWQAIYNYRKPVWLPKGRTVEMRITYDNSDANPRNPSHPAKRVRAGPRSEDEMGHVWLQVLPKEGVPGVSAHHFAGSSDEAPPGKISRRLRGAL